MRSFPAVIREHPLSSFFILAYALSWAFWLPPAFASLGWIGPVPSGPLHLSGGLGPMAAAIVVRASLALALAWAGWHILLFVFSPGLSALGISGTLGWLFSLGLGSILLTWLFNSSGGSIAAVALFHAALDVFMMSPVSAEIPNVMGALLTLGTLLLIPAFGGEHLARRWRVVDSDDREPPFTPARK